MNSPRGLVMPLRQIHYLIFELMNNFFSISQKTASVYSRIANRYVVIHI